MRSIAIPVADREECSVALDVAFDLASKLGADVVGYHMRPSKYPEKENRLYINEVWTGDKWPEITDQEAEVSAQSARRLFQTRAAQHGFDLTNKRGKGKDMRAVWDEIYGTPDKLLPLIGPVNDLLIVSRPRKGGGRKAWIVLMSALLDSCIPVMVLPQKAVNVPCKHIAIAWNRGTQEAHAVHATLALLKQADTVTLLSVGKDYKHGPSAKAMIDYLKCNGINANEHKIKEAGAVGPLLVEGAKAVGADVLLSGAYTKGRVRQMLFGGVTEYLVTNTTFPVILMHS